MGYQATYWGSRVNIEQATEDGKRLKRLTHNRKENEAYISKKQDNAYNKSSTKLVDDSKMLYKADN